MSEKSTKIYGRQGDVGFLYAPHGIPQGASPVPHQNGRYVLAEGEVTGHFHATRAEDLDNVSLFEKNGELWLRIENASPEAPVQVTHDEHDLVPFTAPGEYQAVIQKEYFEAEERRVID